ncbi:hypothetical protein ACOMHN_002804 [Nucella lapillus]
MNKLWQLHRLWHGLPPAPWPCTRSQHHSVPSRNLHPLMVPPFLQPHPDLQSAVGNAPLSSKHPAQLPTTDCLLSIISPMGGQPSDAPATLASITAAAGWSIQQRPCSLASITTAAGRSTHCPGTLASITAAAGWSTQRCPWTPALIINIAAVS